MAVMAAPSALSATAAAAGDDDGDGVVVNAVAPRRPFADLSNVIDAAKVAVPSTKALPAPVSTTHEPKCTSSLRGVATRGPSHVVASPSSSSCDPCDSAPEPLDDATELARLIYKRLRANQMRNAVTENYFAPHLNAKVRAILIDWLVDVHLRFKLHNETLFLAVNYIDRYLAAVGPARSDLQLIATAALFMAGKVEETQQVEANALIEIGHGTCTIQALIEMEKKILDVVKFDLTISSVCTFVGYFADLLDFDPLRFHLASYLSQNTLLHLHLVISYAPAMVAAGCVFLAHCIALEQPSPCDWIAQWESSTNFKRGDIDACLRDLCTMMGKPSRRLSALREKFGVKRFRRVSKRSMISLERFI